MHKRVRYDSSSVANADSNGILSVLQNKHIGMIAPNQEL